MKIAILPEDCPTAEQIGPKPRYKYVNSACAKRDVHIIRQRVQRLAIKNARRRVNGLPPLKSYALL